MDNYFYKIAVREYEAGQAIDHDIEQHRRSSDEDFIIEMNVHALKGHQSTKNVSAIIFSAMVVEAFIFHYASEHLGKRYFLDNLDRLDIKAKWLVVPRLVLGKEINKGGQAYEALSKLVSDRNYLVHHKDGKDRGGYSFDFYEKVRVGADNAMKALTLLFAELDQLHVGATNYTAAVLNTNECHA
ncbi:MULTISPECIES: hypothetical protein [unclassified Marinobacter]|jgi:hypothetical protein|uniref:hypothetical protein n=1 Tax=unclassified Marinobacter TaxID=83889 RepID=UPI00200FA2DB|nr:MULTISPECIES: hypothetical protein [unclassified Marinobacter]MCL1480500.1 hypothetical protein [Marinobacter sp.]MCL1487817.1 hypothetical protein [Marinobacter sp.]UQG56294.1 hypothetical protein MIH16_01050 [Marinobacter sp. M4C]UQG65098.1 hypothetical protein MIH17_01050 [Marinobacter sp. M2C]UQG69377.1 hypothetical protein MIH19_01050 [Marinobacter sp. M1C]